MAHGPARRVLPGWLAAIARGGADHVAQIETDRDGASRRQPTRATPVTATARGQFDGERNSPSATDGTSSLQRRLCPSLRFSARRPVVLGAIAAIVGVALEATPAQATFPGKNGHIAYRSTGLDGTRNCCIQNVIYLTDVGQVTFPGGLINGVEVAE